MVEICNAILKDICRGSLQQFVLTGKIPPPLKRHFGADYLREPALKRWKCLRMTGADAPITSYTTHHFARCLKRLWKVGWLVGWLARPSCVCGLCGLCGMLFVRVVVLWSVCLCVCVLSLIHI